MHGDAGRARRTLVLQADSIEATAAHLAEIKTEIAPRAHAVIAVDGAGRHQQG